MKSHIIPKALTRPTVRGNKFIQKSVTSAQSLYIKRADSWYDQGIVTREGENYLSDFDAHAIKELRDRGILWSSNTIAHPATSSTNEIMVTSFENPNKMRLFFLSLLWRASVSTLAELADIILPSEKVERLRRIIIGEEDDDLSFFPTALIQLTEKGPIHNFIPIKQTIGQSKKEIIRFYMDGLIVHMHLEDPTLAVLNSPIPWEHSMFIGHSKTIIVQVKTSDSFHLANLTKLVKEYEQYRNDKPGI